MASQVILKKPKTWFRKAALQGHTDAKTELDQLSSGKKLVLIETEKL